MAMLRVGLTGGVACGKSTIAGMMANRGARLLNADTLAHELYAPGAPVYDEVVRRFGREILDEGGGVNRARLANVVFPDRVDELNAVVHPAVIEAQTQWMSAIEREEPDAIAVVEAALLIEAGAASHFDKIIVVTCDFERKVERYAGRMNVPPDVARAEVMRRSAAQFTDEEKARQADYLIDNSGSLQQAERQVEQVWGELVRTA